MKPVNSKSLLAFIFDQMERLDSGQIDVPKAKAQVGFAKQANSLLKYEIERAKVRMELSKHSAIYKDGEKLREIESKNFD